MSSMSFTLSGAVNVSVTIVETAEGTLSFTVNVLNDTGSIGDLNGLFFDLADDSLASTLSVVGQDVTGTAFKANSVTKVSNWNNLQGEVVNELGKFDGGVQFGTSGIGSDDIRSTTFTLSSTVGPLTLETFSLQDFGVRLTSVGAEGGARDGSLKLGGEAPEAPADPVGGTAQADTMTSFELEIFNADGFDFLDMFQPSVLGNDTNADGSPFTGTVSSVNGAAGNVGEVVAGSNGGFLIIYPDGSVDFSAVNGDGVSDFDYLNFGEEAQTVFTYGIDGGPETTLTVNVMGFGDGGPIGNG